MSRAGTTRRFSVLDEILEKKITDKYIPSPIDELPDQLQDAVEFPHPEREAFFQREVASLPPEMFAVDASSSIPQAMDTIERPADAIGMGLEPSTERKPMSPLSLDVTVDSVQQPMETVQKESILHSPIERKYYKANRTPGLEKKRAQPSTAEELNALALDIDEEEHDDTRSTQAEVGDEDYQDGLADALLNTLAQVEKQKATVKEIKTPRHPPPLIIPDADKSPIPKPKVETKEQRKPAVKRKRDANDQGVQSSPIKFRLVTPFNINDKEPDVFQTEVIIPPELYAVSKSRDEQVRASLPNWRNSPAIPTRIQGRQLNMFVKEICAFRGSMWMLGFTNQERETLAVEVEYQPVFLIDWPEDCKEDADVDMKQLKHALNQYAETKGGYPIVNCQIGLRYPVAGWTGEQKDRKIVVQFRDEGAHRYFKKYLTNNAIAVPWAKHPVYLKLFNEDIPVECQLMADIPGLTPASWITIPGNVWTIRALDLASRKTRWVTYEVCVPYDKISLIKSVPGDFSLGSFIYTSVDIECVSARGARHKPFALNVGDVITMIVCLCYRARDGLDKEPFAEYTFALGVTHSTEKEMLDDYLKLRVQTDGLLSYNGLIFDDPYTMVRASVLKSKLLEMSIFKKHSIINGHHIENLRNDPNTGLRSLYIPGLWHVDCYVSVKKDAKLQSKKMGNVCKIYLKPLIDQCKTEEEKQQYYKIDLPYDKLYDCLVIPEERKKAVDYNKRDGQLPPKMIAAKKMDLAMIETMRITRISAHDYMTRGQQVKVWFMMCMLLLKHLWALNKKDVAAISKLFKTKYIGAFVIDPLRGIQHYVQTMDFSSLYPSIILAFCLCYTTIITNRKYIEVAKAMGRVVKELPLTDELSVSVVQNVPMERCLLPCIVQELLAERKRVNKIKDDALEAKIEADKRGDKEISAKAGNEYTVSNARQLEVKVIANSVYGFCGISDLDDTSDTKKRKKKHVLTSAVK